MPRFPRPTLDRLPQWKSALAARVEADLAASLAQVPEEQRFQAWMKAIDAGWEAAVVLALPRAHHWPEADPPHEGISRAIISKQYHLVPLLLSHCDDPTGGDGEVLRWVAESCPEHLAVTLARIPAELAEDRLVSDQEWMSMDRIGAALGDPILRQRWRARMPEGEAPQTDARLRAERRASTLAATPSGPSRSARRRV